MENFKEVIGRRSPFSIKLLTQRYVATHLDRIKSLLNREDAVASRLDMGSHRQYVSQPRSQALFSGKERPWSELVTWLPDSGC
jgi:hypothetical protein